MNTKPCFECGKQFSTLSPKFCSRKCFHKNYGKNHRGIKSPLWKGNKVEYHGIHRWLTKTYGRGVTCEKCKRNKRLHWAKITDKKYERIRKNFIELCSSCHKKYDMTQEIKNKISKAKKGIPSKLKGRTRPREVVDKIRIGTKQGMRLAGYNVKV